MTRNKYSYFLIIELFVALATNELHAQEISSSWVGEWRYQKCESGAVTIRLTPKKFDFSAFESDCDVRSINQQGPNFEFNLICQGEGGKQKARVTLRVTNDRLAFISSWFEPKEYVRCSPLKSAGVNPVISYRKSSAALTRPSFDCVKASTADEIAICSDTQLSILDGLIGAAFRTAKIAHGAIAISNAKEILERRHVCVSDKLCILNNQIAALRFYVRIGATDRVPIWVEQYKATLSFEPLGNHNRVQIEQQPDHVLTDVGQVEALKKEETDDAARKKSEEEAAARRTKIENDPAHILLRSYYDYIVVKKCHADRKGYLSVNISDGELERAKTAVSAIEKKMVESDSSLNKSTLWDRANDANVDWQSDKDKLEFTMMMYNEKFQIELSERRKCQSTLDYLESRYKKIVPEAKSIRKDF